MTDLVLFLSLDHFYVQPDAGGPFVVVRDRLVWDANESAQRLGVRIGGPMTRARVLLGGTGEVREWHEDDFAAKAKQWLDICAEHSGWIEPEHQHSAWMDLATHADPDYVARQCLRRIAEATGLRVRVGYGVSKWTAKSLLESTLPLSELPVAALTPLEPQVRERLAFLGYRSVKAVADLPLPVLQGQFGEEAYRILAAAKGTLADPVEPLYPPQSLQDHLIFPDTIECLEALDHNLNRLARRLGGRLKRLQSQANAVHLEIESEEARTPFQRLFSRPIIDPLTVHNALRLMLRESKFRGIKSIFVTFPAIKPTQYIQPNLTTLRTEKTSLPSLNEASLRLKQLYGEGAVKTGSQIEIPRRRRVLKEWQDALKWS